MVHAQHKFVIAPTIALVMSLGACGGGGSSGIASTPPPIPTPGSPPVRTGPYTGPIALQSSQPFATTGYATRHSVDVAGTNPRLLSGPSQGDAIAFRQLPGTNQYELALPGYQAGQLRQFDYGGTVCSDGTVCQPSSTSSRVAIGSSETLQDVQVIMPVPGADYPDPRLTYTSLAWWGGSSSDPADPTREFRTEGLFAYGIPTAAGDVPTSGTGTYQAWVQGRTATLGGYVEGEASLNFDFAQGTLSGEMRPLISDGWDLHPLGTYTFNQTVFGVGRTTFSGLFNGPVSGGGFAGQFTGPQAAELLARWQAPYLSPFDQSTGIMFGVWVGRRQ